MHKVVTINLNGRAFQLDDDAYEALRAYLDRAGGQLRTNPDRVEILADLEQAIADKANRYLAPPKTVLSLREVNEILHEMGPVEGGAAAEAGASAGSTPPPASEARPQTDTTAPRRLYRIMEGSMLGGVCTGLSAFTQIDVNIVRAIVLVVAVIELSTVHSGLILLLYFALMFVLPEASTQEERAAARGMPFNAQEVVENARRFGRKLNQDWRRQERAQRRQRRWERRQWKHGGPWQSWWGSPQTWWGSQQTPYPPIGYGSRVLAGLTMPVLTILSAAIFWLGVYLVLTMIRAGNPEAWRINIGLPFSLPAGMPLWAGILIVIFVLHAFSLPLHMARKASYHALGGPYHGWFEAWDGLLGIGISALVIWWGYHYLPDVRDMLQHLPDMWETLRNSFRS